MIAHQGVIDLPGFRNRHVPTGNFVQRDRGGRSERSDPWLWIMEAGLAYWSKLPSP